MSRSYCPSCHRPVTACICRFAVTTANEINVVILQHTSEVSQTKGSVGLLSQSLTQCQVIIGEDFANNDEFQQVLNDYQGEIALLYPSEHALEIANNHTSEPEISKLKCLVLLDGTWKKAYRIFMLNPQLHTLPHLMLPLGITSVYQIRKTKKEQAFSSLEACCHALSRLESSPEKYQPLLDGFVKFNQFQLAFTPR